MAAADRGVQAVSEADGTDYREEGRADAMFSWVFRALRRVRSSRAVRAVPALHFASSGRFLSAQFLMKGEVRVIFWMRQVGFRSDG
jgi:hypothetical protein